MSEFTYDAKVFVTVHVTAPDEVSARKGMNDMIEGLIEGGMCQYVVDGRRVKIFLNSASQDGEADLIEIDGRPVP